MSNGSGIPRKAAIAINDMLDHCVRIQPGQEILILAQTDGLYGGDNLVDAEAMAWLESAIRFRGSNPSILWIDEPFRPHAWRFPPIVKAALLGCDVFINNTLDLSFEELIEYKQFLWTQKKLMIRNFAVTAPLLCSDWAQTPQELVNEIRYQAGLLIAEGSKWQLSDENGTHLEGSVLPAFHKDHPWFTTYAVRREEVGYYRPWPEWVHPPINLSGTEGTFIFDRMLSWWSRYIGISPYFNKPIRLTIRNNRITRIEGGDEAEALQRFLTMMKGKLGEGIYDFNALHFGVHPRAAVTPYECPSVIYRRIIEHSHTSNIHVHIGDPEATADYPYWLHVTGDIRKATFKVGDKLIHDRGYLTVQDLAPVKAIAAKYPGRPGLE